MNEFFGMAFSLDVDFFSGIAYAFIYLMMTIMTFIFLLTYIKRMITVAFLIIISPIITITYSIDKMGDGKSQALNRWMKEFIYNILIQPFHCIIYLALVQTSFQMLNQDDIFADPLGRVLLAFMMVIFMYQAEDIVKNIFNFQSSSMPKTLAQTAIFATALNAVGKAKGASGKAPKSPKTSNALCL